mmetsp:Transcript_2236/g.2701  ORF Transcript_2236/g.2701 Transcript_2236/m.2701 type:complete len:176 (-) Transcript_2236:259-786(-)
MVLFGLPPGIPAIILLLIATAIGVIAGIKSSSNNIDKEGVNFLFMHSPTKPRAAFTLCIALPFWLWALEKVIMNGDPDLGAISFLLVIVSCGFVLSRSTESAGCCDCSNVPCIMLLLSNALVSLNYIVPLSFDLPLTLKIYFAIAALYWAILCVWNWKGRKEGVDKKEGEYESIV